MHSALRGGATLMALTEARFLARSYDLVIAVPPGPLRDAFAPLGDIVDGPPSLPIWTDSPSRWAWRSLRTARDALALAALIRRRGIDLVLTNSSVSLSPVLAARLAAVPAVVHARDTPFSRFAPALTRAHARLADVVVANSAHNAARFGTPACARLARIPDGIEIPPAPPARQLAVGRPLRLAVVGTLTRDKGQDVAIAALAELRRRDVAAELRLVGPEARPGEAQLLRDLADELGVLRHVHIAGESADVDEALAAIDVVLVPSRGESAGLVAMEALARAVPVVASDVGGVPEVVSHGRTGLLVPVGDADAIAEAVVALLLDPDAAAAMAARGRSDMAQRYALPATLAALSEELQAALRGSAPEEVPCPAAS